MLFVSQCEKNGRIAHMAFLVYWYGVKSPSECYGFVQKSTLRMSATDKEYTRHYEYAVHKVEKYGKTGRKIPSHIQERAQKYTAMQQDMRKPLNDRRGVDTIVEGDDFLTMSDVEETGASKLAAMKGEKSPKPGVAPLKKDVVEKGGSDDIPLGVEPSTVVVVVDSDLIRDAEEGSDNDATPEAAAEIPKAKGRKKVLLPILVEENGQDQSDIQESKDAEESSPKPKEASTDKPPKAIDTSPPKLINGIVDFSLDPLTDTLSCRLCQGYFRDPYTVTKCLHTFCKSCLFYTASRGHYNCPTCDIYLGKDASKFSLPDRTLEYLIDKILFPELVVEDAEHERQFYRKRGIQLKPQLAVEDSGKPEGRCKRSKSSRNGGQVSFTMVPVDAAAALSMPPLERPNLETDGAIRIGQLKKYLQEQLLAGQQTNGHTTSATSSIDVLCNGVPLGNELSVDFVWRTVWMEDDEPLTLSYRYAS